MNNILVTGGAGYIGSFMVKRLLDEGKNVLVVDSLERGNESSIDERAHFYKGNLLDRSFLRNLFSENEINAVIHFAGYISMAESMQKPELYFENNVTASCNLIENLIVKKIPIVFSSTAGVYGNPASVPIGEDHLKKPTNPYGQSKLITEEMLAWHHKIHGLPVGVLRYFNASGAALDGSLGEKHHPESHIIPNIIRSIREDKKFILYGGDYNTPDGTAVRDYIHVLDLVEAHLSCLEKLFLEPSIYRFNVGTGRGYSNREVIAMIEEVSGKKIDVEIVGKRPGDASVLVADTKSIKEALGFHPRYSDLKTIAESAWTWHSGHGI